MITVTAPKRNTMKRCLGYEYFLRITEGTKIVIHNRPYKKMSEIKLAITNLIGWE